MKKHILFLVLLISTSIIGYSQCNNKVSAFTYGEKLSYEVYYNLSFLWFLAGEAHFDIYKKGYDNSPAFYFKSTGKTTNQYDWFYKVRDSYEAISESSTLKSLIFHRKTYEGGYEVNNNVCFNHDKNKIYLSTRNSKKNLEKDTLSIKPCTFDILTAIYYCRNIDYSKHQVNDTIPICVVIDNEITYLHIRYLGKEQVEKPDGEKYKCIKFSVLLVKGSIFTGGENMTVWVSDDENRIPIIIEAKILVGSIKAIVSEIQGARYKISSKIN